MSKVNTAKKIEVTILDSDEKVIDEFVIKRLSVATNTRRLVMTGKILESDVSDVAKNQLLTCAALASTLCDKKGDILYPTEDGYIILSDEIDVDIYDELCKAYVEINPLTPSLKAKKKKY